MQDILRNVDESVQKRRAWFFAIGLSVYVTLFMLGGNSGDVDPSLILNVDPIILLITQGLVSLFMFVIVALLFARFALKLPVSDFFPSVKLEALGIVTLITLSFMVVNSSVAEWNLNLDFPDSSFEEWAKQSEEILKVLTEHLTNFDSFGHYWVAMLVIAVIPALGEELLFRGLIQNLFTKAFSNHHVAIWLTGFLFAAIHMQFYGVFPRALLGVLFGYIYVWSGNLSLAMIAHFINNGFALTMLYLARTEVIEVSPDAMESSAPWPAVLVALLIGFLLMRIFHKKYHKSNG